ncbi:acyl carrier protein [Nonomuraea sp. NPDC052265]|uniref:acyl carrier protein n=1 Tax=Nonomuraea sp. NPDC052265 TaxID=3364374 RepID=UPI0037CBE8E9
MNDEVDAIGAWLAERIAVYLDCETDEIGTDASLVTLGVDSVYVMGITGEIQDRYDIELDPSTVWDHPTVSELAKYLHGCLKGGGR